MDPLPPLPVPKGELKIWDAGEADEIKFLIEGQLHIFEDGIAWK